jgi:hypothetical protein
MKKIVLAFLLLTILQGVNAQNTYYWVGGASDTITKAVNWNTSLDGSGSNRASSSNASDILIFNGANLGGATTYTGPATVQVNGTVTCAQLKFINNASVFLIRTSTGTGTININGDAGEDFVIESGTSVSLTSTVGSVVLAMVATTTGRVSGNFSMITTLQARIANTTAGTPGSLIFTSGSNFTTNITAASAAYAFGNNSQSSEKWVIFQAGSNLYYEGGFSPMASSATFMPIDFKPGSTYHIKASNPTSSFGTFTNRKSFANVSIENGATFTADGPIYRIDTLTVTSGSTMTLPSSGQTAVTGPIVANGTLTAAATSTNELVMAGTSQTISGSGTVTLPSFVVSDNTETILQKNITVNKTATILGKLDLGAFQLSGAGSFTARTAGTAASATGTVTSGSYLITGVTGAAATSRGFNISGTGIAANTNVVSFSANADTIYISKPAIATAAATSLSFNNRGATLATSHPNGFDSTSGAVTVINTKTYQSNISYIINGATSKPFGMSSGTTATHVDLVNLTVTAAITTNSGANVSGTMQLSGGKFTIRQLDTLHLLSGAVLSGSFSATNYFVTDANTTTGAQGIFRYDGLIAATLLPVGTINEYLPATVTPSGASDFAIATFRGITNEGTPNGTPLSTLQKQTKIDAVWNINRVNGSGSAGLKLSWPQSIEGSTFTTLASSDIGIITNLNPSWSLPVAPGDNTLNIASGSFTSFGAFSIGAQPPATPFVFNALPVKTYGDADFNAGVISLNTTTPITYTSSNTAVATIVGTNIHIVGIGTTNITASQATDGFYPAVSVTQSLTVNKAPLTIKANDLTKPQGDPNPTLTVTYTGFVNGETAAVLGSSLTVTTTATTTSPAGTYPITPSGATAANYTITLVPGTLTVTPRQTQTITFAAPATKTYGNADFAIGASSTNNTIPITYTSSNTSVATIVGSNIHIVGAGTSIITASQAGGTLFFAAPDVARTLTVNKANLTVRAVDTTRAFGQPNPAFRVVYTGFVLGENIATLTTQPVATTTATTGSAPGYYPIDVSGGVAGNYNFVYTSGRLTILPATGAMQPNLQVYRSNTNTITVKIYSAQPDIGDIYLYDMSGRVIMRKNVFIAQGFLSYDLNVMVPASGMYIVKVFAKTLTLQGNIALTR